MSQFQIFVEQDETSVKYVWNVLLVPDHLYTCIFIWLYRNIFIWLYRNIFIWFYHYICLTICFLFCRYVYLWFILMLGFWWVLLLCLVEWQMLSNDDLCTNDMIWYNSSICQLEICFDCYSSRRQHWYCALAIYIKQQIVVHASEI